MITTPTSTAYYPTLFDINNTFYAVPTTFTDMSEAGNPNLELTARNQHIVPDNFIELSDDWDEAYRAMALRLHLDDWTRRIIDFSRHHEVAIGKDHYLVGTDGECDDDQTEHLRQMIVEADMPHFLRDYIDEDRFVETMKNNNDRAHHLARKDGVERIQEVEGTRYFIYRTH